MNNPCINRSCNNCMWHCELSEWEVKYSDGSIDRFDDVPFDCLCDHINDDKFIVSAMRVRRDAT